VGPCSGWGSGIGRVDGPVSARRRRVAYPTYENDALAHALALVAVPVLFGLLGAWLDSVAGTRPILLLAFGAFGVACSFASAYYRYESKMARHDEGKPWARKRATEETEPPEGPGEIGGATA
jgi:hypothetical protein